VPYSLPLAVKTGGTKDGNGICGLSDSCEATGHPGPGVRHYHVNDGAHGAFNVVLIHGNPPLQPKVLIGQKVSPTAARAA
jgi:hypothetical protein